MNLLGAFVNAFKVPDLRKKILFTLLIIAVYRFGAHVPTPGIDVQAAQAFARGAQGGVFDFINLFSGGALTQMAIFALGIMPYITSSIIMQLLTVVIPRLEAWSKEGESGYKKITQWTRYLTVLLAILQSTGLAFLFHSGQIQSPNGQPIDLIPQFSGPRVGLIVLSLTAGTALIMWLGELITQRGIGNGMSILIFASIVSTLPTEGKAILDQGGPVLFSLILLMGIGIILVIVMMEQGQRRIAVQYAKRIVGRRQMGGQSTYIPLKVNQAGVIPIIFASSVLYLPVLLTNVWHWEALQNFVNDNLLQPDSIWYITTYGLMIIGFAYFYTAITFDPHRQADTIRKQGGFIPGIRPGPQTERYLAKILSRITLPGALFIAAIAVMPVILLAIWDIRGFEGFGGTSLLIAVGVALETMKQIDSQLMMRNYE